MSKLKTFLELARLSNLPTVWSNALVGACAGAVAAGSASADLVENLRRAWPLMVAMSLLYAGGMILNDAMDAKIDAKERPGRPIPSGRVPRARAFAMAGACLAGGLLALAVDYGTQPPVLGLGAGLAACIVGYNLLHAKTAAGVVLMGACRGLIILTCAAASGDPFGRAPLVCAFILTAYTIGLSLVARGETRVPGTPKLIMRLIAAMCLLDGLFLWGMGLNAVVAFAVGCFVLTTLAHRRILGS